MNKVFIPVVVAVILALSFVLVANIMSDTAISIKNKGYVFVKGFAKQQITSDLGAVEFTIVAEDMDLAACYAKLARDKEQVSAFIKKEHSIKDDEATLQPAWIKEVYKVNERGYDTDEFIKYVLKQKFHVESSDVNKIDKLSSGLVDILNRGVKIAITDPTYVYTKLDDLKVDMIGRATDNARERAQIIAKKGKFRLGPISNVRVGIFQITPAHSTEVSDYGMNDTSTIEKEVKSVVEIKYFVK